MVVDRARDPDMTPMPVLPETTMGPMTHDRSEVAARLEQSLSRVIRWVQGHQYKAYEPADGNASVFFPLTGGRVLPMRVLQQIVLRSPFNVRPLIGVRKHESPIGRGYMAWGYLILSRLNVPSIRNEAAACLQWLT